MDASKKEHTLQAWCVVLAASCFFFYQFVQLNLLSAIGLPVMQAFDLTPGGLGQLAAMYFYANAIFLFPAGLLLDRYSTKILLLGALILSVGGTALFSMATHVFPAALGRFMVGTGAAFSFLSCVRLASHWFPPQKMALATGVAVTMAMLGGLVAQTPMALLSAHTGWRYALRLDVLLGIFIFFVIVLIVKDHPPGRHKTAAHSRPKTSLLASLGIVTRNPNNWLGGLYTSLMNLPVFLLGALWGIPFLMQVHHLTQVTASWANTLLFVGVMLGSPAFGWVSDHLGRRVFPMIVGAILSLPVILVLLCVPSLSPFTLILLFFLTGFLTSSQVLSFPLIAELNPPSLTSTAVSIDSLLIMLSGAICQPLFGWFITRPDTVSRTASLVHAMWSLPIAFALSLVIAFFLRESYCRLAFTTEK